MGQINKPIYGQLYRVNIQLKRKKLNSIWIDDSLVILNKKNASQVLKYGTPVDMSFQDNFRDFVLQLFTDTVMEVSEGKTNTMQEVFKDIIAHKGNLGSGDADLWRLIDFNAKMCKKMTSTTGEKKVAKGTVICNPTFSENEFLCYLGKNNWLVVDKHLNKGDWTVNLNTSIEAGIEYQIENNNKSTLIIPAEKVLNHGVWVTRVDLKVLGLEL